MHRGPGVKISNYLLATKQVDSFSTVEQFWGVYTHLKRVDRLPFTSEFQVFRKGVKPMWEDPVNAAGGKWVVRFKRPFKSPPATVSVANSPMGEFGLKTDHEDSADSDPAKAALLSGKTVSNQARNQARLYWEKLLLSVIGGTLASDAGIEPDDLVGLVMSVRRDEDILNVWTRSRGVDGDGNLHLRDAIRNLLELPESIAFEFKVHTESIKEGEQKQALYNNNVVSSASASIAGTGNGQHFSTHGNSHGHHHHHNNNHHSHHHHHSSNSHHHSHVNNGNSHNHGHYSNHSTNGGNSAFTSFANTSTGSFSNGVFGTRRNDPSKAGSAIW